MSDPANTHTGPRESAESALRLSEATKSAILASALDCIITIDHRGHVIDFNPAAERTFGYTRAEALGREMGELIVPPHLREMHRRGMAHAVSSGKDRILGQRIEIVAMRKNGEEFPVELAITRIHTGGDPVFTGHIRDITERKRTEQRLAAQYAVTRVLSEATTLAEAAPKILRAVCESLQWDLGTIWSVDADAKLLRCVNVWHAPNDALAAFVATTRTNTFERGVGLPGRIWAAAEPNWIPDVTQDANFPRASVATESKLHSAFGFPIRLGDEVLGVIEFFSKEIRKPNAEILEMFTAIGSQIGQFIERKEAEDGIRKLNADLEKRVLDATSELRASQERFHKAFHASPAVMTLTRLKDGRFVDVNAAFCKASEFSREAVLGHTADELNLWPEPGQRDRFIEEVRAYGMVREREMTLRARTGRFHSVLLTSEVIAVDRTPHLLTVALDINVRKQAEAELRVALEREKELSRLKTNFVTLVSHEFRTPLGVILSSAQILETYFDRLKPDQRSEHLRDVQQSARHMAELMEEVLLLGRVEAGRVEFRPEQLKLREFCEQLVEEIHAATNNRCPIEFKTKTLPARAIGDTALIRHILTNLLSNAVKYSQPGGAIQFTAEGRDTDAIFRVKDKGIGIPEADLKQLFQSFHRAANVGQIPGTGLGMVLVKRCVELHNGDIQVESKEGQGTTITVRLPLFEK